MMKKRRIHFNSCFDWLGEAWTQPHTQPPRLLDMEKLAHRVRLAEEGRFNALFVADFYTYRPGLSLEPITLMSALIALTKHIGVVISASTTYNEPYNLARMFASLDQLSGGRAGWNMVTTAIDSVSENYSRKEHMEHDSRYARAHECVQAITRLWDSWDDDALLYNKAGGRYLDTSRVHPIDFHGNWIDVAGPLNIPRSPQGQPVRSQAGVSEAGREFGARWAELIFTAQPFLPIAQDFYTNIKTRAQRHGRSEDDIRILPGLLPLIAPTRSQAQEQAEQRVELRGDAGTRLKELTGVDVTVLPQDDPIPLDILPDHATINSMRGRADLMLDLIRRYRLTPRQVLQQDAHLGFAGTPADAADMICEWYEQRGCDGFTLIWPSVEINELFVREVVPILQRRGIHRREYDGTTLREHFDLQRPASTFATRSAA